MAFGGRAERLAVLEVRYVPNNPLPNNYRTRIQISFLPHWQGHVGYARRLAEPPGGARDVAASTVTIRKSNKSRTYQRATDGSLKDTEIDVVYRQFQQYALTGEGALPSDNVCNQFLAALCTKGGAKEALRTYSVLKSCGVELKYNVYQMVLNACLSEGDIQSALRVFRDLQGSGMVLNQVTYCGLISGLGKFHRRGSRSTHVAYELWQELLASPWGSSLDAAALRTGMKACADVRRMEEAEALLNRVGRDHGESAAKDVRMFNILLKGYATWKDWDGISNVMDRMVRAGIRASAITYNTLLDAHVRARDLRKAHFLMAEAIAAGVKLDAWSYTTLMKGYVQGGDMDRATDILQEMERSGIRPTYITYSILLDGYVRAGDFASAQKVLDVMTASGASPSSVTFNSLVRGYAAIKKPHALKQALQLLDDMQARGVAAGVDTFNTLMSAAVAADDGWLALDLYRRLQATGLRPDGLTYTVLLQAHAKLGQVLDAVSTFEALSRDPNASMDIAAYNAMVDAFSKANDMEAAEKMLQRACDFARRWGLPPPVEAFGAVVSGYVRLKLVAPAIDTVRRFHAAGGKPDEQMLDEMVDLCVRTGEFKVAMQAVRAMELIGVEVDKEKYRSLVKQHMRRTSETWNSEQKTSNLSRRVARPNGQDRPDKNVYLERFKFWLGLPNSYYE